LAEYKISAEGVRQNGVWRRNKKEYPHILPIEMGELNILRPYREEFWEWFRHQRIKLHTDFHHLSSSQAMCFNLFFPFIAENGKYLHLLSKPFVVNGEISKVEFELILDNREGTNFDFCIFANSRTLFELKLTESDFGGGNHDESHFSKFDEVYSPRLGGKFRPEFCSRDVFLRNYQIMRNVWNLAPETGDKLVFLAPRANKSLQKGLAFLHSCVSGEYRSRVSVMYLEDAVSAIEHGVSERAARMREQFKLFRLKYLPSAVAM
jgi:hypothetical protein